MGMPQLKIKDLYYVLLNIKFKNWVKVASLAVALNLK